MNALATFNRHFWGTADDLTVIGAGKLGGKAQGLATMQAVLASAFRDVTDIVVGIPRMTVITTEYFDEFMTQNDLFETAYADNTPDSVIAHKFLSADLPVMILGDLRSLIEEVHTPLAVRSSSLLEDAMYEPFAGIYATKMIPNNQPSADARFAKLVEAVKFVYASTFFQEAKAYLKATSHAIEDEKMAVIIQEVVGTRRDDLYYPTISGVARSYNFYPAGRARPEDGVASLALGLGKTIVDGGACWSYSPKYPKIPPPHGSVRELLDQTQLHFWAVNMGKPPEYDPSTETEYLRHAHIMDAERDGALEWIASTYDAASDRIEMGTFRRGPRILTFAPILELNRVPLNRVIRSLLSTCKTAYDTEVEIEFALTFEPGKPEPPRFGFLQVRPMVVSNEVVEISDAEMTAANVVLASEKVLGNGCVEDLVDIVYVDPETFDSKDTRQIAGEIAALNDALTGRGRAYVLIGFGRWGSSDPWLGIPVNWSQIHGAKVIVEATLPQMNPDLSQGSHFFHNITSFQVFYLSAKHSGRHAIDWAWLQAQEAAASTGRVRHLRLPSPLRVKLDGRRGRGVILR